MTATRAAKESKMAIRCRHLPPARLNLSLAMVLTMAISACAGTAVPAALPAARDVDGNVYRTVRIGDQVWMAENLRVTRYRDGSAIPEVRDDRDWAGLDSGASCIAGNAADPAHVAAFGRLYNWHAINDLRGLAPEGWHVPSVAEWQRMLDSLGGAAVAGGSLKALGTVSWAAPNTAATDSSGFTALPGGVRDGNGGPFFNFGEAAYLGLTATEPGIWYAFLESGSGAVSVASDEYPTDGFSIRCVKDDSPASPAVPGADTSATTTPAGA